MNSVNDETSKFTTVNIDFDKDMVIAVFDQVLGSGGSKIQIEKIRETPEKVLVDVRYIRPAGNVFSTTVMNQPYHIVVLPKIDKKVEMTKQEE